MEACQSFVQFLKRNRNSDEVNAVLTPGIAHKDFPSTEDQDNLFAVSQHFMKNGEGDPQQILEALVIAYHRWILANMRAMTKSLERCVSANRVVFVEESTHKGKDAHMWQDLNKALSTLSGDIQDFGVTSNYVLMAKKVMNQSKG